MNVGFVFVPLLWGLVFKPVWNWQHDQFSAICCPSQRQQKAVASEPIPYVTFSLFGQLDENSFLLEYYCRAVTHDNCALPCRAGTDVLGTYRSKGTHPLGGRSSGINIWIHRNVNSALYPLPPFPQHTLQALHHWSSHPLLSCKPSRQSPWLFAHPPFWPWLERRFAWWLSIPLPPNAISNRCSRHEWFFYGGDKDFVRANWGFDSVAWVIKTHSWAVQFPHSRQEFVHRICIVVHDTLWRSSYEHTHWAPCSSSDHAFSLNTGHSELLPVLRTLSQATSATPQTGKFGGRRS